MILSSHIIIASAASALLFEKTLDFQNAIFIFGVSLASHFLIDMIPHWDYQMFSFLKQNGKIFFVYKKESIAKDLAKNFFDGFAGMAAAIFIVGFPSDFMEFFVFGLIVLGAILPDALEALFIIFKWRVFEPFHKFHTVIHGKRIFQNKPFFGFIFQAIIILIITSLLLFLF